MKIRTILTLLILSIFLKGFPQIGKLYKSDPTKPGSETLENKDIKKLLATTFSKVVTGQSTASPGRYASLNINETDATFSPSFLLNDKNIITLKFQGGITEGVSSFFNNSKLNTNVSLEFRYHLILNKRKTIVNYKADDYSSYFIEQIKKEIELFEAYEIYLKKINVADDTIGLKIGELKIFLNSLKNQLEGLSTDNLHKELEKIKNDNNKIYTFLKDNSILNNVIININAIAKKNNLKIQDAFNKIVLTSYKLDWFTFGCMVRNDDFRLLHESEIFEKQIEKTNFVSPDLSIQFSHYYFSENDNSLYYAISASYTYTSNYLDLNKTTVAETNQTGNSGISTRSKTETFIAYNGNYINGLNQGNIKADFIYFFNCIDRFGLHIFQNSKFTHHVKPLYNLGFGFVIPFKDQEKEKSIINAEIYYNVKNIFNTDDIGYSFIERNEIGLRFTLPLNF